MKRSATVLSGFAVFALLWSMQQFDYAWQVTQFLNHDLTAAQREPGRFHIVGRTMEAQHNWTARDQEVFTVWYSYEEGAEAPAK